MGKKRQRPRDIRFSRLAEGRYLWETMRPENHAVYMALRADYDEVYRATRMLNDAQPLRRPMAEGGWRAAPEAVDLLERTYASFWPTFARIEQLPKERFPGSLLTTLPRREDAGAWLGGPSLKPSRFQRHNAFRAAA